MFQFGYQSAPLPHMVTLYIVSETYFDYISETIKARDLMFSIDIIEQNVLVWTPGGATSTCGATYISKTPQSLAISQRLLKLET